MALKYDMCVNVGSANILQGHECGRESCLYAGKDRQLGRSHARGVICVGLGEWPTIVME